MVSIVITTFNRENLVSDAVESALAQTYKDIEVVVVDDGSTDNTRQVLDKYIKDEKIVYHYQENKGCSGAKATGVRISKGDYVALLDSDDIWYPDKLERQIPLFEKNKDVGVVYSFCTRQRFNRPDKVLGTVCTGYLFPRLILGNCIPNTTAVFRKELVDKIGNFDENLSRSEDWDFWLRCSEHVQFDLVPEILAEMRVFGDNLSHKGEPLDQTITIILDRIFSRDDLPEEILRLKNRAYANRYLDFMGGYLGLNRTSKVWACFFKALKSHPRAIKPAHISIALKSLIRPFFRKTG
ncbi:MAG: glycosyltransferase [Candidatus Aminicenantes bacterium]|nr:MAG: glycosyltransferase [Candidatus Aminicenantes bacterium]